MRASPSDIERCIRALLSARAESASICPSDVARSLVADENGWRALMPAVRDVAARLAREGALSITQGSETLDPAGPFRGPIRLRRGRAFSASS